MITDCVFRNDIAGLRRALARGQDANERTRGGRTPLMYTPLHFAAQEQHRDMAKLLIDRGATIDAQDHDGNTPLSNATFYSHGRGELIELLLEAGANQHLANNYGQTPFGLASLISNYNVKKYFEDR
jgi:ankyrin repeat protein